ncbi:nucleotide-binding universal stress UspA family protein [Actimicrobium sp. GrIS 1.19]|uniref:universal stress protein n=1 Tax=Actimicrobium sp. GrIS 1.19 TaxID=3071708 RepID=UPI002E01CE11|nr:nucleotide-binding universal stress UspA family protein [Actimicrobium sp. GrIS 1.19]
MSYQTILVHVDATERAQIRIDIAARMAESNDGHLVGLAATGVSGLFYLPGAIGESNVELTAVLALLQQRAGFALTTFDATVAKTGLRSFERRVSDDEAGAAVSLQARYSDLVVIGQTDPQDASPAVRGDFPEYVVMHGGRPVLVIPYAGRIDSLGKRILVAWDGSMPATRAVTAAIPLLQQAELVQIVIFDAQLDALRQGEQPGADIALYLARHGVNVEVTSHSTDIGSRSGGTADIDIGNALLSYATDCSADLIVMGAYTHSRFREILLGGVTSTVLKSMTIPVLMAH